MTLAEAVGRIFDFKGKRFYVAKCKSSLHAIVIDLEAHMEVLLFDDRLSQSIPEEWKEILPP